jgi:hypothetical protein
VSAQLTWRTLDEAGNARTAVNRPDLPPLPLVLSTQRLPWSCNLPQERYNFLKPMLKKEISA